MKNLLLAACVLVLGSSGSLLAQNAPATNDQPMGRGRGGAPYAWNDKNKDGICDLTGKPVGQGRGQGMQNCGRRGRHGGRGFRGCQRQSYVPAPQK